MTFNKKDSQFLLDQLNRVASLDALIVQHRNADEPSALMIRQYEDMRTDAVRLLWEQFSKFGLKEDFRKFAAKEGLQNVAA